MNGTTQPERNSKSTGITQGKWIIVTIFFILGVQEAHALKNAEVWEEGGCLKVGHTCEDKGC